MSRIKKFNELTKELQETIKSAKDKLLNAIIDDAEISKLDKLKLIHQNDLFSVSSSIEEIFINYQKEFIKQLGSRHPIIDDYFTMNEWQRHEIIYMDNVIEYMDFDDDGDDLVTILKDRSTSKTFKISVYEFIDTVYDWCISNKKIGFEMDW